MHHGGKKKLLWHHLMCVTVCVFWFVRTNVERRRKSLNPLCLRGLRGWGGSIIGLLPIHSLCHVTSAPHRLVERSPSRISIFSPPFFGLQHWGRHMRWTQTIYQSNSGGCCPSYLMAHYPTFAPILHCLIRERERDNVRYEVASGWQWCWLWWRW